MFLNGHVNAAMYVNDIYRPEAVLFLRQNFGRNGTLQHDNARPRTAQHRITFLRNNGVQVMEWPAMSPDLSPTENVWAELKHRVYSRRPSPANVRELRNALTQEWNNIPQYLIGHTIGSMRRRCQACINAAGGYTKY